MAYITYNKNEAIFIGLFFGIFIIAFIFLFSYPSEARVNAELTDVKKELNINKLDSKGKEIKRNKVASPPKSKKKNVIMTKL